MFCAFLVSTICLAIMATVSFPAQTTSPQTRPADNSLAARLEAVDRRSVAIEDLTATFVQEKRSPLLRDPLVTSGEVRAVQSAMLWSSRGATPTIISIDSTLLRIYYVDQKVVEEYPVEGNLAAMAASPLPRLAALRESFSIEIDDGRGLTDAAVPRESIALRLTPNTDEMAENVDSVRVLLDADRGVVLVFEVTDPDGEVTIMRFADIKTNVGLSAGDLTLKVPADVKIVRPLGNGTGK